MVSAPINFNIKYNVKPLFSSSTSREKSKQTLNALHNRSHFYFTHAESKRAEERKVKMDSFLFFFCIINMLVSKLSHASPVSPSALTL